VGEVRGVRVGRQQLAVWRGADGVARAVDAFCPHMGTDLATGRVVGDTLRCFFHHWRFDGDGRCAHIPARPDAPPPARAHTRGWPTAERYGLVWAWPEPVAPAGVPDFPGLEGVPTVHRHGRPIRRTCHHHVCMINGIDVQHLATVHDLPMDMGVTLEPSDDGRLLDVTLAGPPPTHTWRGRAVHALLGGHYSYAMRYHCGTLGLLTTVRDTRLLGRWPLPPLRMLFAYRPEWREDTGRATHIYPVFVAPADTPWAQIGAPLTLEGMRAGFHMLRDEDGQVYDHIRFQPGALLPDDTAVARYIAWVNKLPPGAWGA
jgi:phenylpropionate dioxygenase-like ring-hydroxylating dioxygenase large terminal subunit